MPAPRTCSLACATSVTLLAIEEELRGVRLHDAGRRAFDAHRKPVAVRQAAADSDARRERVLRHLYPVPRVLFVQARQRDVGILRHRPPHRLAQRHGMNLSVQSGTHGNSKEDCSIHHPLIVSRQGGRIGISQNAAQFG